MCLVMVGFVLSLVPYISSNCSFCRKYFLSVPAGASTTSFQRFFQTVILVHCLIRGNNTVESIFKLRSNVFPQGGMVFGF